MESRALFCGWMVLVCAAAAHEATAQEQSTAATAASVIGTVVAETGSGTAGVLVVLEPLGRATSTDYNGTFAFANVDPGTYSLVLSVGDLEARVADVEVRPGEATTVSRTLPRDFTFVTSTTVVGASRSPERIVDAPAPITRVGPDVIALEGASGQIPALLRFTVGADYVQSGLYDINFNTRGFNNMLSYRVQTLVDGRDTAVPEASIQEWYSLGFLMSDLESVEFLRGPSASLYGANTINGVIMLKTKAPRDSLGGRVRLTVGELDTMTADARWAVSLGRNWYMKLVGNSTHSATFLKARNETVEYPGLPKDTIAPKLDGVDSESAMVRFDRYLARGDLLVTEGGLSKSKGEVYVTPTGRPQVDNARREWVRTEYSSPFWNLHGELNHREAKQTALWTGFPIPSSSTHGRIMVQGNRYFHDARIRAVFGGSYQRERIDSADERGVQTLFLQPVTTDRGGAFGQVDYLVTNGLKLVGGVRWDDATLHPTHWSPRVAAVVSPSRDHSLRFGYNRGFQVGTYPTLFLNVPAGPPADLSLLEAALSPLLGGARLGFETVPVFAIGNPDLDVEKIQSLELGYTGAFGSRGRIGVEYYQNYMRDFITDLSFGVNPRYPAYRAPAPLPAAVRAIVEQTVNNLVPGLTNRVDGGPQIVLSNGNTGRVESRGIEVSGGYRPVPGLWFDANYTWFDFTIKDHRPGAEPKPNAPENGFAAGAMYQHPRAAASFHYRWVDDFLWSTGLYVGPVPSYGVADLNASVRLNRYWELGVNVSNLFNKKHYEMFGGDILERRALVHPTFSW